MPGGRLSGALSMRDWKWADKVVLIMSVARYRNIGGKGLGGYRDHATMSPAASVYIFSSSLCLLIKSNYIMVNINSDPGSNRSRCPSWPHHYSSVICQFCMKCLVIYSFFDF